MSCFDPGGYGCYGRVLVGDEGEALRGEVTTWVKLPAVESPQQPHTGLW